MKHYRLLGILLMLENHGVLTAKNMADHFEVSTRTIYRDLDCLSEAGYSVITESGKGGGISLGHNKRLRVNAMDEIELARLIDKLSLYDAKDPIDHNLMLKIRGQLPTDSQTAFDKLMTSYLVDSKTWSGAQQPDNKTLTLIQRGIINNQKLQFGYTSANHKNSQRVVWPQGIVKKAGMDYLVGFCELRSEMRTFKLVHIQNMVLMDAYFTQKEHFDLRQYWDKSMTSLRETRYNTALNLDGSLLKYPVTLASESNLETLLSGINVTPLQAGGYLCDLISEDFAVNQLFRMADKVKIIAPVALRNRLIERAKGIIAQQSAID